MINKHILSQKRRSQGTAAVEFAVIAPIVFLFSFAAFEFMRICLMQNAADIAAYEACRKVMVPGSTVEEAETEAQRYLNYMGSRAVNIRVRPRDINRTIQSQISDETSTVEVRIRIPAASNVLMLSKFFGDKIIEGKTTLTFESYSGFYDGAN